MESPNAGAAAHRVIVYWIAAMLGIGILMAGLAVAFPGGMRPESFDQFVPSQYPIVPAQIVLTGLGMALLAGLAWVFRQNLAEALDAGHGRALLSGRPYLTLFTISFVVLFVEVMLIRYVGSQFRIFAFYKNIPLIASFLGLGLGCFLGNGKMRHALLFLLWTVPLAAVFSQGAPLVESTLSVLTAFASSEFVMGNVFVDYDKLEPVLRLVNQIAVGGFCVAVFVPIAGCFTYLGRLLGTAIGEVPRLQGYTVNIAGSLAGILAFVGLSFVESPPWIWFLVGLAPLIGWLVGRRPVLIGLMLILLAAIAVFPSRGETVWSRYQKLIGLPGPLGYTVMISDVFYQSAMDLRPEAVARLGYNPAPLYDGVWEGLEVPDRVLIVGAGTGNDVAAALRFGAKHVDAVDIDPAIVAMGRLHHPEKPYDDPRVDIIIEDARRAFRNVEQGSYDAVVFGLLDSHTQLGVSSVRLDNYVFTMDSFIAARRLLKPGGHLIVGFVDRSEGWLQERFLTMLEAVCDSPVRFREYGAPKSFVCRVDNPERTGIEASQAAERQTAERPIPTDDWPFLYLPSRAIPQAYIVVIAMLGFVSLRFLWTNGLSRAALTASHAHMFFMGAAFLLMEVYAINRLALLFGTTWLVSAVAIGLVLSLIILANATVLWQGRNLQLPAFIVLFLVLGAGYLTDPGDFLGRGTGWALLYGLFILSPVYFAGLIFAQSFRLSAAAGPAIGANILGAVLGGWVEYATMVTGIRSMVLLAFCLYAAALVALLVWRRRATAAGL